jgi:hypothetical protein
MSVYVHIIASGLLDGLYLMVYLHRSMPDEYKNCSSINKGP